MIRALLLVVTLALVGCGAAPDLPVEECDASRLGGNAARDRDDGTLLGLFHGDFDPRERVSVWIEPRTCEGGEIVEFSWCVDGSCVSLPGEVGREDVYEIRQTKTIEGPAGFGELLVRVAPACTEIPRRGSAEVCTAS